MSRTYALLFALCVASFAWTETAASGTLQVQGRGQVAVTPDIASTSIQIRSRARTAQAAATSNAETIKRVIAALENLGVSANDIHTSRYQFRRDARDDPDGNIIERGYFAEMSVDVTVRDFDDLGKVITAAISAGATSVQDYVFSVSDTVALVERARSLAFEDARKEAEKNAAAAKVTLIGISSIADGRATLPGIRGFYFGGSADMPAPESRRQMEPEVLPDMVAVGYDVTVTYEFK